MKRIITYLLALLVALVVLSFAVMNAAPVHLDYYFSSVDAPLSLIVVIAITVGACMGVLSMVGIVLRQRREIGKLRKSVKLAEQEVTNLRTMPLRDNH